MKLVQGRSYNSQFITRNVKDPFNHHSCSIGNLAAFFWLNQTWSQKDRSVSGTPPSPRISSDVSTSSLFYCLQMRRPFCFNMCVKISPQNSSQNNENLLHISFNQCTYVIILCNISPFLKPNKPQIINYVMLYQIFEHYPISLLKPAKYWHLLITIYQSH